MVLNQAAETPVQSTGTVTRALVREQAYRQTNTPPGTKVSYESARRTIPEDEREDEPALGHY
eukprot:1385598-Rhodomonas_salina.2